MIIYKVTNKINNKCYIGQTSYPISWRRNDHILKSKRKSYKCYFHNALNKYGEENFIWKILEKCKTKEELDEMEFHYIKQYNSFKPNGYNLTWGGEGSFGFTFNHTEKTKQKIKKALTGVKHTKERKENISKSLIGRKHTKETKRKIGKHSIGNSYGSRYFLIYDLKSKNEIIIRNLQKWIRENPEYCYGSIKTSMKKNKCYKNKWFKRINDLICLYGEN